MMRPKLLLCLALFCLGTHAPAQAQLLFSLNPAGQSGAPGTTLTFNATLTNTGTDPLYLNGDNASLLTPGLTLNDSLYFDNFPLSLLGGDAVTADIFQVSIDPSVQTGDYIGSFSIVGGADANVQDTLATQYFLVDVGPPGVPESGGLALLGAGMLCILPILRRRR